MEQGLYSLGSNMKYLQKKVNVTSNNVSNSDTNGFKKDIVLGRSFNGILSSQMEKFMPGADKRFNSGLLTFKPGVYVEQVITKFTQGRLEETDNKNDIAISGSGFITIDTEEGPAYLRSASVETDEEGYLCVPLKGRIVGQRGGFIRTRSDDFTIDKSGTVYVDGRRIDAMNVVDFTNFEALHKKDNGIYINSKGLQNITQANCQVLQGKIEASNVDMTEEMINMVEVSRRYETSQRAIQMLDQIYQLAANEIGKV